MAFPVADALVVLGGVALVLGGLAAAVAGVPALIVLRLWKRGRGTREQAVARLHQRLPERRQRSAARVARVLLWLVDRFVRRRLLPWLLLSAAGVVAVGTGCWVLVEA